MNACFFNFVGRCRGAAWPGVVLLVILALDLAPVTASAQTLVELQRAFQERYYAVFHGYLPWPANADGVVPPAYPPLNFYNKDLADAGRTAELVKDLAAKMKDSSFLDQYLAPGGGDINGLPSLPTFGAKLNRIPPAEAITPQNAPSLLGVMGDIITGPGGGGEGGMGALWKVDSYSGASASALTVTIKKKETLTGCQSGNGTFVSPPVTIPATGNLGTIATWIDYGHHHDDFQDGNTVYHRDAYLQDTLSIQGTLPAITNGYYVLAYWSSAFSSAPEPFFFANLGKGGSVGFEWGPGPAVDYGPFFNYLVWHFAPQTIFQANLKTVMVNSTNAPVPPPDCQCTAEGCAGGQTKRSVNSLDYRIDMGRADFGKSIGSLFIKANLPDASLATPDGLHVNVTPSAQVLFSNNAPRQVLAPMGLVDVVATNGFKYVMSFYMSSQVGATNAAGLYQTAGAPYKTITVENPNASSNQFQNLRVTESQGSASVTSDYAFDPNANCWSLADANGLRCESRSFVWDANRAGRFETHVISNATGRVSYKETNRYRHFPWGEKRVDQVIDPEVAALTNHWDYYENQGADGDNYGLLKRVVWSNGGWERYQYDCFGRVIKVVQPFLDTAADAPESACRVVSTSYGLSGGDPAQTVVETLKGVEVSRRYTMKTPGETREIQACTAGAAWNDPGNLVRITTTYTNGDYFGEVKSVRHFDGTLNLFEYATNAVTKTTTISSGAPDAAGTSVTEGVRTVSVKNLFGTVVAETSASIPGNNVLSTSSSTVDDFGRALVTTYGDGTAESRTYDCCGLASLTDREGITTTYMYDDLKRLISSTRAGITTLTTYDAEGRVLATIRKGSDNTEIALQRSAYDLAGRPTSVTDALAHQTAFSETSDADGHRVRATTLPDGATRVETYARDNSLLRRTGTASHPSRDEYGVDGDGRWTREIRPGANGAETEWTKISYNLLGQPWKILTSAGAVTRNFYNNQGQRVKQVDADGVTTLFQYSALGDVEYTALDMNRNGQIDFIGPDRITHTQRETVTAHGTTVRRITTSVCATDGSPQETVLLVQETSADGLSEWNTANGLTTATVISLDPAAATRTVTTTAPDGTVTTQTFQNGLLLSSVTRDSSSQLLASSFLSYDPHQRPISSTDARGITTEQVWNAADQLTGVVLRASSVEQRTSYVLDALGRRTQTTLPDGGVVSYSYLPTGEMSATSGSRTYTAEYSYDGQGRLKTLLAGSGLTTWNYDPSSGFLASKVYADGTGPTYAYTAAGRLASRTWARGITTTYTPNGAGEVAGVTYSDSTPAVASTFDRLGHRISVSSALSAVNFSYNDAGQVLAESWSGGVLNGLVVSNSYDSLLRRSSLSAATSALSLPSSAFGYDSASRLSSVTSGSSVAQYSYLPNASLVDTLTFTQGGVTRMTTTKQYDGLNRLTSIASAYGLQLTAYSYAYNAANQRTQATLADSSRWEYTYDSLGQVTGGSKKWADGTEVGGEQFGYAFDGIGNRQSTTVNGRSSLYTANALNQYTKRTVPGAVDVSGTAATNATVTVNGQAVSRQGDYFWKELSINNSAGAVCPQVTAIATGVSTTNLITEASGKVFLPQNPERITYDADGNLTSDGRWTYSWDAENRLIAMESMSSVPSVVKTRLEFAYDFQGRRIQKKVYGWSGSAWLLTGDHRFVWDGWNLIAEINGSGALIRSYVWGLDLSGSMDGAGGVGGLLSVYQAANQSSHFAAMDGNGNVMALVDAASGLLSAEYEYGPFGEAIRQTGSMAKVNPFRLSTKYRDDESGLLYYGYRYLNVGTGRWLSRDPIEEDGGVNLYGFLQNDAINTIDKLGLVLVVIDGTDSQEWVGQKGVNSHVLNFVRDYTGPGTKLYMDGPSTIGRGVDLAVETGYKYICSKIRKQRNDPIFLVGHSRGALVAILIAEKLKNGCPCQIGKNVPAGQTEEIKGPIEVKFLGLYDAVSMEANHWAGPVTDNVSSVASGTRDPKVGSRTSWGNTGQTGGQTRADEAFFGTHSAMGGDPSHGDVKNPQGQDAEDEASLVIDLWMRQQAASRGATFSK